MLPLLMPGDTPEVNLDYAASTPVLAAVWEAVREFAPRSSSVHRGSGPKSRAEAINVLAESPVEHHANMLPWRRHDVRLLPFTRSPAVRASIGIGTTDADIDCLVDALREIMHSPPTARSHRWPMTHRERLARPRSPGRSSIRRG